MKRQVPVFIKILQNWYENVVLFVKWNNIESRAFQVTAGVRQGGILSPALFLVYVDDMLIILTKLGCKISMQSVGALLYADDDLLLLSPSISQIQILLTVCEN